MIHKKLIEVLNHLSKLEVKRFRLFLQSPYFNQSALVITLFDYLVHNISKEDKLSKESVLKVMYPDMTYFENQKNVIDSLASDLFALLKQFLGQARFENENLEIYELLSLSKFYRKNGFEDRFWSTMKVVNKKQRETTSIDAKYYLNQYEIQEEISHFKSLYNSMESDNDIPKVHENLDLYFTILKLEHLCSMEFQLRLSSSAKSYNSPYSSILLQFCENINLSKIPIIRMFLLVYKLIQNPLDDNTFLEYEKALKETCGLIPLARYTDFAAYYRNFAIRRHVSNGNPNSKSKIFEIYKEHYEKGYFLVDDKILIFSLRNLMNFSLRIGEYKWAKNLLDSFPPDKICGTNYPEEIYNINYAEYYFFVKEFDKSLNLIAYKNFNNPVFGILADILVIKVFFETQINILPHRLAALDIKVRRTKFSENIKERYLNFIRKINNIIKYGYGRKSPNYEKRRESLATFPNIVEREWLLDKIDHGPTTKQKRT